MAVRDPAASFSDPLVSCWCMSGMSRRDERVRSCNIYAYKCARVVHRSPFVFAYYCTSRSSLPIDNNTSALPPLAASTLRYIHRLYGPRQNDRRRVAFVNRIRNDPIYLFFVFFQSFKQRFHVSFSLKALHRGSTVRASF